MKKFIVALMCAVLVGLCGACAPTDDVIDIYLPDGAPALSLVSVFDKTEIAGRKVRFVVVPSENITSYLLNESADMAIVPTNAASIVYNQGRPYKYVSANTHGNLFVVGKSQAEDLSSLVGKVVGVIGQNKVPDFILRTLLTNEGLEYEASDVKIEGKVALRYVSDGAALPILIDEGSVDYGLFAEPAVTAALKKVSGLSVVFDMQELWGGGYPQAGLVAKDEVDDEFISELFALLEADPDFALNDPAAAKQRIDDHMIESTTTTIKILDADTVERCNIRLVRSAECKDGVKKLLNAFLAINPASVGGKLPDDSFFRIVQNAQ